MRSTMRTGRCARFVGMGTGALARACLERSPRTRIRGIDTDPDMIAIARTRLGRDVHRVTLSIGNFVEVKNSKLAKGATAAHLSYIGDASVGEDTNIGAGAITCNYDGAAKHQTTVGDNSFIGTNVSLVAPLTVGEGAYVGAGSVVTKDVPPGALAVGRAQQTIREGWVAKKKERQKKAKETE